MGGGVVCFGGVDCFVGEVGFIGILGVIVVGVVFCFCDLMVVEDGCVVLCFDGCSGFMDFVIWVYKVFFLGESLCFLDIGMFV